MPEIRTINEFGRPSRRRVLLQNRICSCLTLYNRQYTSVCSDSKYVYLLYCVWASCWPTKLDLGVAQDQVMMVQKLLLKFFIQHDESMTKPTILRPGHIAANTQYYKDTNTSVHCPWHLLSFGRFIWRRIMSLVKVVFLLVIACYFGGYPILKYILFW